MSKAIKIDITIVWQDPVKDPSIVLMRMMAVKGSSDYTALKQRANEECLFSVLQEGSKVRQERTKKANTHTQTEDLCQMKTNDGKGNRVRNMALQSSLEHVSLSEIVSAISLSIPTCCSYVNPNRLNLCTVWTLHGNGAGNHFDPICKGSNNNSNMYI